MSIHTLHATDVKVFLLDEFYATCSCGWRGLSKTTDQDAADDALAHRRESRR